MKRLDLSKYLTVFIDRVEHKLRQLNISQAEFARRSGVHPVHLNMILKGTRKLTAYYLYQFISKGALKVDEIYTGQSDSPKEAEFWKTAKVAERVSLMNFIANVEEQKGIDVEAVLRQLYPDV